MKAHLQRLAAPKSWVINRKASTYVLRPKPSGHSMSHSIPLVVVIRDLLKFTKTAKEVKYVLQQGNVLVNGVKETEIKRAVGLMDILDFPSIGKTYCVLIDRHGKIALAEQKEKKDLLAMVRGKTTLKGKRVQLNLSGGMNVIAAKDLYRTGDSIIIGPNGEIKDHFSLDKGSLVYFIGGKHVGGTGIVDEIRGSAIIFRKDGVQYETPKRFAFVIGKDKPAIDIP
jgi:small subunit ribosomal protein S4e